MKSLDCAFGDAAVSLAVETVGDGQLRVRLSDGTERTISARRLPDDTLEITDGNRIFRVLLVRGSRGTVTLAWEGETFTFTPATGRSRRGDEKTATRSGRLVAAMGGTIAEVSVEAGAHVVAYQTIAVVEAMKVLASVEAPFAGIVRAIAVKKGERVEQGALLAEIVPEENPTA